MMSDNNMDLCGILSSLLTAYYYCQRTQKLEEQKKDRIPRTPRSSTSCSALDHQMCGSYIFHQEIGKKGSSSQERHI
jgi:hypothetical protein